MGNVVKPQDTSIPPPIFGKPYPINRTPQKMPGIFEFNKKKHQKFQIISL